MPGQTPIIPVMTHEAALAQKLAAALDERGVYVAGFFYPVVPQGRARIRTQMSSALSDDGCRFRRRRLRRCRQGDRVDLRLIMKALAKAKSEPGIWMIDAPVPEIGPEDVLVRVHKTGICGTDVHIYNWDEWAQKTIPVPMITGHEYAGEIVAVGSDVTNLKVGQRVSGEGHVVGMNSRASRAGKYHLDPDTKGIGVNLPGAFAEFVRIPAFNIVPLPDAVDDEIGAILDPLGNAVHTALAFDLVGEDVIVTGAGPIGIMSAAVARQAGARHVVITDVSPERLKLAAEVADVRPVDVSRENLRDVMAELKMKEGFDVGLEMSGAAVALDQMIDHLVMGGRDRASRHSGPAVRFRPRRGSSSAW